MSKADALIRLKNTITGADLKKTSETVKAATDKNPEKNENVKLMVNRIAKWGVTPAAAGAGTGLGVVAASEGVKTAFGIDTSDAGGTVKKISGWAILIVLIILALIFYPKIKQAVKKVGK